MMCFLSPGNQSKHFLLVSIRNVRKRLTFLIHVIWDSTECRYSLSGKKIGRIIISEKRKKKKKLNLVRDLLQLT